MMPNKLRVFDDKNNIEKNGNGNGNGTNTDEYTISDYGYGKNNVKILHVSRNGSVHLIKEFEVSTHLKLYSTKDYLNADNSDIVATDSQKNTVYLLAKKHGIKSPEEFGVVLANHFLKTYRHVKKVHIHVEEYPWERLSDGDGPYKKLHNHAFVFAPMALRCCDVLQSRNDVNPTVISGLKNLRVLKTTQSSFVNFVDDEYRSLPDMGDRIFSTIVQSSWEFSTLDGVDFDKVWMKVKQCIISNFAGEPDKGVMSPSVQNTLYLAERDVLNSVPQVWSIDMEMPNKHYFTVDLTKFPKVVQGENREVFLPIDKPSGIIYAKLDRKSISSKL